MGQDLDGRHERAVELYALAECCPKVAHSPWYADVFGQPAAALAANLRPEAVVRAQERGQALDLKATMEGFLVEHAPGASP